MTNEEKDQLAESISVRLLSFPVQSSKRKHPFTVKGDIKIVIDLKVYNCSLDEWDEILKKLNDDYSYISMYNHVASIEDSQINFHLLVE